MITQAKTNDKTRDRVPAQALPIFASNTTLTPIRPAYAQLSVRHQTLEKDFFFFLHKNEIFGSKCNWSFVYDIQFYIITEVFSFKNSTLKKLPIEMLPVIVVLRETGHNLRVVPLYQNGVHVQRHNVCEFAHALRVLWVCRPGYLLKTTKRSIC